MVTGNIWMALKYHHPRKKFKIFKNLTRLLLAECELEVLSWWWISCWAWACCCCCCVGWCCLGVKVMWVVPFSLTWIFFRVLPWKHVGDGLSMAVAMLVTCDMWHIICHIELVSIQSPFSSQVYRVIYNIDLKMNYYFGPTWKKRITLKCSIF